MPMRSSVVDQSTDESKAARVQRALATSHDLTIGPVTSGSYSSGLEGVGGDFVDLIDSRGKLIAVLGDVSGKGTPASLVAAVVLSSVQHHVDHVGAHPGELLRRVHQSLNGMLDRTGKLVTLAIAVIDPNVSSMRIASAGHHPVMLASASGVSRLGPTCPPLGADVPCGMELEAPFIPGSTLLLASDGITEQLDDNGAEFGLDRLALLADDARRLTPDAAIARVIHVIDEFSGNSLRLDDQAVVVVRAGHSR